MRLLKMALIGALLPIMVPAAAQAADDHKYGAVVPADRRDATLGDEWADSADRSWTTAGDADGFHLLVADESAGYRWRTAATLSVPGVETDRWIGNVCLTGSGRRAVVVYAPRTYTNEEALFDRGGYTAVVDLTSGAVKRLNVRTSLAYFNPGCGPGEDAVLTQNTDRGGVKTRLLTVDGRTGAVRTRIDVPGQLTSPVPTAKGIVAADRDALVRVDAKGTRRVLARTSSTPFRLAADDAGGAVFMERNGKDRTRVRHVPAAGKTAATLAEGALTSLDVTAGRGGRVFVTGSGKERRVTDGVTLTTTRPGSRMSTEGRLALAPSTAVKDKSVKLEAVAEDTGQAMTFAVDVPVAMAGDPGNPADFAERYCSVPRNDPRNQAMQPKPRQVEWAVDQAVRNSLYTQRPANWKNLGMPAYTPQGLFPPIPLAGGGNVPAQIMLAITAQESNMWQAARYAVPGVTANPLIGNYYGIDVYNDTPTDDWTIHWDDADCGYGVTQVTDGMRLAGRTKPGETALPYQTQRAVALDFAANVAGGLQILQSKWNQTRNAGLTLNNGDPRHIENWFYAVWAYNSGFYPQSQAAQNNGAWGVGWANNPVNPKYPANRGAFLSTWDFKDDYADAAHPQDWSYPEKIMGWAARPLEGLEAPDTLVVGYRAAWWGGDNPDANRYFATPLTHQFCDITNDCYFGQSHIPDAPEVIEEPAGPCAHRNSAGKIDLKCWYHVPSTWQVCPQNCGNEVLRFDPGYAYQADGEPYLPKCDLVGLPSGARVIDNLPADVPSIRPGCNNTWGNAGTFGLTFRPDQFGDYPGKVDTHQLGMGLAGHFWMANSRSAGTLGSRLDVDGTWKFSQDHYGLGKIIVHLPQLTNGTTNAYYTIKTKYGDRHAVVNQKGNGNRWVSLGTYTFSGKPEVSLSTVAPDGTGSQRVAYDAVAFVPVFNAPTAKVMHWNIAGVTKNNSLFTVLDEVVRRAKAAQADVLSINEICLTQFNELEDRLAAAGWAMAGEYQVTNRGNAMCLLNGGSSTYEGVGIFARGSVSSRQRYRFNDVTQGLTLETGTTNAAGRGIACVTTLLPNMPKSLKACSTHLDTGWEGGDRKAAMQVAEMRREFRPEAQAMPFVLAGDTNIPTEPVTADMGPLYGPAAGTGDFNEAFSERDCAVVQTCLVKQGGPPTFVNGKKLDYIFASRWHTVVPMGRAWVDQDLGTCHDHPCSDHFTVHAEVQIPDL